MCLRNWWKLFWDEQVRGLLTYIIETSLKRCYNGAVKSD